MNKLERQLSAKLNKVWPHYFERIEPKFKGGIPDVLLAMGEYSIPLFVELKVGKVTLNKKTKEMMANIKIENSQRLWHRKYPGKSYFLIEIDEVYFIIQKSKIREVENLMPLTDLIKLSVQKTVSMKQICLHFEEQMVIP